MEIKRKDKITMISVLLYLLAFGNPIEAQIKNKVAASAEEICPILVGEKIPQVSVTTVDGKSFNINEAVKQKPTILIFYRGGWCPYCNMQLEQLRKIDSDLVELGYQLLAISMDRPEKLQESMDEHNLNYTILSDSNAEAAKAFGLAFKVDDKTIERYKGYNIDLEAASGEKHHILPVPGAFVVGTDEVIYFEYVNPNYKVRIDPDVLMAAAKSALKNK